jgi:DNA-binding transcriptional regulator YhcF (GntR family)
MLIQLQPYSDKPIYEQLILEIKRGIITGELTPGEALPSVRMLASDIGINMHTVNKVYKHLQNEKVLVKQKSGFIVNPQAIKPTGDSMLKISEKIYELMIDKQLYGISDDEISTLMQNITFVRESD